MYTPEASPNLQKQQDAANRVNDLPRGNYMFATNPEDWQVSGSNPPRLVPVVTHVSKEAGNCGVDTYGNFAPAEAYYKRNGITLIPHDVLEGLDYVAPYTNKKGAKVHRSIFQTGYQDPAGVTQWTFDQEAWDGFLDLLRDRGIIKQPRPQVVEGLITVREQRLASMRAPAVSDGEKYRQYEEECESIRGAIKMLKAEHEKSVAAWGAPKSPGRSKVRAALDALKALKSKPATDTDTDTDAKRQRAELIERAKSLASVAEPEVLTQAAELAGIAHPSRAHLYGSEKLESFVAALQEPADDTDPEAAE
ncbi:MAG: hypothetical protein GY925_26350 [Actinomycetia bacterium]|nr:hypothetical protein [Actinomycetes bacterium]